jgi:CRP-like cAMP-binding protein
MVERLIVLRQQLPFSRARLQALAALAHASDEVDWPGGTRIITPGEAADAGLVLVDGIVHVRRPDGTSFTLGPGEPLGYLETLAATEHSLRVETTTPVRALRSTATAIQDVLEDHTDVGVSMLAAFSALLLDTTVN